MTDADVFAAIRGRFEAQVSDPLQLPTVHDNGPAMEAPTPQWCRFSVSIDQPWRQASTGNPGGRRSRATGTCVAQVFVPLAKGDAAALAIAGAIVAAFRHTSIAPQITFLDVGTAGAGEQDQAWCRRRVVMTFRADELG